MLAETGFELAEISLPTVLLIAGLLASAAVLLTAKKDKGDPVVDDQPEQLATKGTFIPLIIGEDLVSGVFAWVQPDPSSLAFAYPPSGGKGAGGASKAPSYSEAGIQILCVGPASGLTEILQNGKTIMGGGISPLSHPSGSSVDLGVEGAFKIFWGESDQPQNATLAAASNHGINSRWPHYCYVEWEPKELGSTPQWPRLKYRIQCPPRATTLSSVPVAMLSDIDDSLPVWGDFDDIPPSRNSGDPLGGRISTGPVDFDVLDAVFTTPHGADKTIKISNLNFFDTSIGDDMTRYFSVGEAVVMFGDQPEKSGPATETLASWGSPAGQPIRYYVAAATYDRTEIVTPQSGGGWTGITTVYLGYLASDRVVTNPYTGPVVGTDWRIRPCKPVKAVRFNPAVLIDQLMFAPFPWGGGSDREEYDMGSLEEVAQVCQAEDLRGSYTANKGESADSAVAKIMQDVGMLLSWDIEIGKFIFQIIRPVSGTLPTLPDEAVLAPRANIKNHIGPRAADKLQFAFRNGDDRNYKRDTVPIRDDSQASERRVQKPTNIDLHILTDFESAQTAALRRSQEVLASASALDINTDRSARLFRPGTVFLNTTASEIPLRVLTILRDVRTSKCKITCVPDYFGIPAAQSGLRFGNGDFTGGGANKSVPPNVDHVWDPYETSRVISQGRMRVVFPRIRSSKSILGVEVWASRDGTSYQRIGVISQAWAGGLLAEAWVSQEAVLESGPLFTPQGPDINRVETLTGGLETSWQAGRQIVVCGQEVAFLREIEAVGDNYRLKGLLGGKGGTEVASHAAGDAVYIGLMHELETLESPLFQPGSTVHLKLQPFSNRQSVPLQNTAAKQLVLNGSAVAPYAPHDIHGPSHVQEYATGANITLKWSYRPGTAEEIGYEVVGVPGYTASPFTLKIYDSGGSLVASRQTAQPLYEYTGAQRATDFGLEPPSFNVEVLYDERGIQSMPSRRVTFSEV